MCDVVAGEFARRALETRRAARDEDLLLVPIPGIKQDVSPRRIDRVVLARNLREVDFVDIDPRRVAAPADVHQFRLEREKFPECFDRLRRFVLEQVSYEHFAVDIEL
jgi:hypothetical protein